MDLLAQHGISQQAASELFARVTSPDHDRWVDQVTRAGHCARPIRLQGQVHRHGRLVFDTDDQPDRVLLKACGNRRRSVCPSCSDLYAGDMWQLLAAGIEGGRKGVPAAIRHHPMVFVTLTAPSFGRVHGQRDGGNPCSMRGAGSCEHGRSLSCHRRHGPSDPMLGQALCADCYDYEAQALFNWHAPELWRRFRVALPRALAHRLGVTAAVYQAEVRESYAKVAEFQARGVVHFHAIIRIDGLDRDDQPGLPVDVDQLAAAIHDAAHDRDPLVIDTSTPGRRLALRFGAQVDVQPIDGHELSASKAAGYIAKYATKATEDFGLHRPVTAHSARHLGASEHAVRLVEACELLATAVPAEYARMRACTHQFGWRGHFSTKSRAYSVTLGQIRQARADHQRHRWLEANEREIEPGAAEHDGDQVERSEWQFSGVGYTTTGDAILAASAAARARARRRLGREIRREMAA